MTEAKEDDVVYIDFEPYDPENPFNWPKRRKWVFSILSILFTGATAWTGATFAIGVDSMESDIHPPVHELSLFAVGVFPLGFALPPLVTAPFSEVYGRRWVFLVSELLFILMMIPTGLSNNIAGVIVSRFLCGACGSTGSTLVGGMLADIWTPEERGPPMALFATSTFFLSGLGPAMMGLVVYNLNWRWVLHIQAIAMSVVFLFSTVFLRETRGNVILSKRAAALRKSTGENKYRCKYDSERVSIRAMVKTALTRPLYFLVTEPIVTFCSIYIAFAWGTLWGFFSSIPIIVEYIYGFNTAEQGLAFLSLTVGSTLAVLAVPWQERKYRQNVARKGPEARLYIACAGGIFLCGGGFITAFSEGRGHWIGPLCGVGLVTIGIFCVFSSIFAYMADAYMTYASSAIAAQSFARNIVAASFPLFSSRMYLNMAQGTRTSIMWAGFLMGMISLLLTVVPFVLFFYGETIRRHSKVVQQLLQEKEAASNQSSATTSKSGAGETVDVGQKEG